MTKGVLTVDITGFFVIKVFQLIDFDGAPFLVVGFRVTSNGYYSHFNWVKKTLRMKCFFLQAETKLSLSRACVKGRRKRRTVIMLNNK